MIPIDLRSEDTPGGQMYQRLPWSPEPFENIVARFDKALEHTFSITEQRAMVAGETMPPGCDRKHVMDTDDGVRIMATRDEDISHPGNGIIHLSFGLWEGTTPYPTMEQHVERAKEYALILLKDRKCTLVYQMLTTKAYHMHFSEE